MEVQLIRNTYNRIMDMISLRRKNDAATIAVRNVNNFLKSILFARYMPRQKTIMDLRLRTQSKICTSCNIANQTRFSSWTFRRGACSRQNDAGRRTSTRFRLPFVQDNFCSKKFLKHKKLEFYQENVERKRGEQRSPEQGDPLNTGSAKGIVDAITCQFAAHYAFYSQESARQFVDNVYRILTPGGIFVGTAPQGTTAGAKRHWQKRQVRSQKVRALVRQPHADRPTSARKLYSLLVLYEEHDSVSAVDHDLQKHSFSCLKREA